MIEMQKVDSYINDIYNYNRHDIENKSSKENNEDHVKDVQKEMERNIKNLVEKLGEKLNIANRRLDYKIDRKIDQIYVRILDKETSRVIKEIPAKSLRDLHRKIQEQIGLLFDKEA